MGGNLVKRYLGDLLYAILGGIGIGVGGTVYLSLDNKVVGAFLFTIGLFIIMTTGLNLFTGKVAYIFDRPPQYLITVLMIYIGNFLGTGLVGLLIRMTRYGPAISEAAGAIVDTKLSDSLLSIFILAALCNFIIFAACDGYNRVEHELGKYLGLFLGVAVFILCGFEHCIANMFYFTVSGRWAGMTVVYLAVMTAGNIVGGVTTPLTRRLYRWLVGTQK